MAVVLICYKMPYKDHTLPTQNAIGQRESYIMCNCSAFPLESRYLPSNYNAAWNQWKMMKKSRRGASALHKVWNIKGENRSMVFCSLKSSSGEKQLRSLDSYFERLKGVTDQSSSISHEKTEELLGTTGHISAKGGLDSLNSYLGKLSKEATLEKYMSSANADEHTTEENRVANPSSISKVSPIGNGDKMRTHMELGQPSSSGRSQSLPQNEKTSDLYLISILASINIAVFLFEIASPVKNSEFQLFSLPLLYGAKVNDLILVGEWWRLVTPMFLHSGFLHVALGCWSLLTFGPKICQGYGSFTFFLIYMLGGIFGNLTSYLHTPEPTVGGTGPIFSLIGAWLIYQLQNKDVLPKDVSESLFQKAMLTTALSFILSHFGPIDDWTHLGAAFTGIVYGFFTCPMLQLDDASSTSGQDEGIMLIRRYADPCKSLVVFGIFILFLSALVFLVEPPLDTVTTDDFV